MGFLYLLRVASMPILQVLIISVLGAFMASDYLKILPSDARKYLNRIVFVAFTPSLVFASLARTVNLQDIISWWFMPVNIGMTFLVGGILGWIAVKIVRPDPYIGDLIIAMCSSGNLGNIMLIIIPAICNEDGNPFGEQNVCTNVGLSYVSFSMALGAFFVWTHTFHLIRRAGVKYKLALADEDPAKEPNKDIETNQNSHLLNPAILEHKTSFWSHLMGTLQQLGKELLAPPVVAAAIGLVFGAITFLRDLVIGENAPFRVIDDSIQLLGNGTIPCITLILGGNLIQGLRKATLKPGTIIAVICVRGIILPAIGIGVVRAASYLGLLPPDPLYHFVLMIQFTVPPAMNIGTMTQLFDVAQEECSVFFLWTYLFAALALTTWSTVFMWILS